MKKIISKIGLTLTGICMSFLTFNVIHAADSVTPCDVTKDSNCVTAINPSNDVSVSDLLIKITTWVLNFAGAVAVLFIIYGGFVYVTAAGNEKRAETAKKILTYAVIGLIVIVLSRVIVVFVRNSATSIINQPIPAPATK